MSPTKRMLFAIAVAALGGQGPLSAQTPPAPPGAQQLYTTIKVEGTENVYIFRYQRHQSMFVVTEAGVIATDPIGFRRPEAVAAYISEIRKITSQPVRYVIYSHSHFDHIAGGKPFKDLGARFIAHKNAKTQLERFPNSDVVMPDELVDEKQSITLGGTTLELLYVGKNHSDNSLVMRLPKERIIFAVDFIPVQRLPFRNMPDTSNPLEWQQSLRRVEALDWDRMIPGHPDSGGRFGTKQDINDLITYFDDLGAAVKQAASEGKCIDGAMKDVKLPKYEKWENYANFLPLNVERMCYLANGN